MSPPRKDDSKDYTQKQSDKNKLYSLYASGAECIAKGNSRQHYKFGV
jgi:hypothetical protein